MWMIWLQLLCIQYQMEEKEGKSMALYRDDRSKPWQVLDDYTLNVLAEFETMSEAEDYARSHGQSTFVIRYDEYHALVD